MYHRGILLDVEMDNVVYNISEDYVRRGGYLCILGFPTSVFFQRRTNYCITSKLE
jgi:hypothetical protein